MISTSSEYKTAIVGQTRRIRIKAAVDLTDPDIEYGSITGDPVSAWSNTAQLHDRNTALTPIASFEPGRWLLDGSFALPPPNEMEQTGLETSELFNEDKTGTFAYSFNFSGVAVLQEVAVYFPKAKWDGYGVDFTISVYTGETEAYTESFTGNNKAVAVISGFTVNSPSKVMVTVTKWSLPLRRLRMPELVIGVYEEWTENDIAEFSINMQGNFSTLALPYGTCVLSMDNLDRRFEPRNKSGVFRSIEDRQEVKAHIGVDIGGGTELVPVGVYYQSSGGWKTGNNDITMKWELMDIVGLLADRAFEVPNTLPTTLSGWVAALVSQLGSKFADRYSVDPNCAGLPVTALTVEAVQGAACGDILLWACQAAQTWARADAETGYLTVEPFWDEGVVLSLDNLESYPVMKGNDDIAAIDFTLSDGSVLTVSGNSTSSQNTASVENPFLHTEAAARKAAQMMLSAYGGNRIETIGRGDPSSEIGDVATVELDKSSATTGRVMEQSFEFQSGVLSGCKTVLLQADGSFMFQNRVVFTESGVWTAPAGVTTLRLILIGKGSNGTDGTDGTWTAPGERGLDGAGARVWAGTITINAGSTFNITIGANSAFGTAYSSANGVTFANGYTDIASGDSYARPGVAVPVAGSGDGGAGGYAGMQGHRHNEIREHENGDFDTITVIDAEPTPGGTGIMGATGSVVIYYDI